MSSLGQGNKKKIVVFECYQGLVIVIIEYTGSKYITMVVGNVVVVMTLIRSSHHLECYYLIVIM